MEAADVTRKHGACVAPNIREWWPYLTDQDIQTLNTWRWHTGRGLAGHEGIVRAEIRKSLVPYPSLRRESGR